MYTDNLGYVYYESGICVWITLDMYMIIRGYVYAAHVALLTMSLQGCSKYAT